MGELVERVDETDRVLGVVGRAEAIRNRWLHRIATTVCRDADGRILVHRRPADASRFPRYYNWLIGGAVDVGESYEAAAAREIAEELGVRTDARLVVKFLCDGAISPYWLGLHEAVLTDMITPDASEITWHAWLAPDEFASALRRWDFVPDSREALARYEGVRLSAPLALPPGSG
ncbi:NUDIX domain-containing protein [Yinghuangia soli]|uniref:NUDIX domain-containing protein n=1 Tax=Yinghuangia soli TaxID=2908204 RepID=A0AA41U6M3_9ACTN|nr:NUDIX domain-containing protein [Yinghuangia soli]MCF2533162.1 NUDIX domain-containing protein [Yinghuangia soli]